MKKNRAVVLMGGISAERAISLITGKACSLALKKRGYKVFQVDAKGNFSKKIKILKPNFIFNALHGKFGEDGFVQKILENLKIPYTHSGVISSSIAMDKVLSKFIFKKFKILTPKYFVLNQRSKSNVKNQIKKNKLKFPLVFKPTNEGSSIGVSICKKYDQLIEIIRRNKKYKDVMIEQYVPGQEIQVAVMGSKPLGAIELRPKRKFYDYKAKYSKSAKTQHIMPAPISKKKYIEVLKIAKKAHKKIGCRGITRSDFRFYKNKFYLLEINTQPGMTALSLVPEIARFKKISFENLVEWIAKDSSINR
jgi:D-alanine-D-alanine ligase|tara:strand:- start:1655 stop:2575 length:921 start_codon:yes stop_codon:yes gene_type:complete